MSFLARYEVTREVALATEEIPRNEREKQEDRYVHAILGVTRLDEALVEVARRRCYCAPEIGVPTAY